MELYLNSVMRLHGVRGHKFGGLYIFVQLMYKELSFIITENIRHLNYEGQLTNVVYCESFDYTLITNLMH